MAINSPRRKVNVENQPKSRDSNLIDPLANWINNKVEIEERLSKTMIQRILWIILLITIYIFFQHNFENLIRKLNNTQKDVKADRAAYISHKSKYMFASKQSEIEKKLIGKGFEVNAQPPIKIEVNP